MLSGSGFFDEACGAGFDFSIYLAVRNQLVRIDGSFFRPYAPACASGGECFDLAEATVSGSLIEHVAGSSGNFSP
mgnify:CR=1 FL=1